MKNLFTKFVCIALICNFSFQTSSAQQCPTIDDISYPSDITLSEDGINANNAFEELNPDNLIQNYGYVYEDVYPIWEDPDNCDNIASSFEDLLFTGPTLKVLRSWTVIDWDTNETTTYVQIIKNIATTGSYCLNSLVVSSDPFSCSTTLQVDDLLAEGFNYQNLTSDPVQGTQLEQGTTDVSISGTVAGEDFSCTTSVVVIDNTVPIALVDADVQIILEPTTCTINLTPEMIDAGSYDACSDVSLSISPEVLTEDDAGSQVVLTLTATDAAGNYNIAWTLADVLPCGSSSNFNCLGLVTIAPLQDNGIQVYPEDFLTNTSTSSGNLSMTIFDEDGNVVVDNYFEQGDYGSFDYTLTDNATGESCTGVISIPLPYLPCEFLVCDDIVNLDLGPNGQVTFTAADLNGELINCGGLTVIISDINGDEITSGFSVTITENGGYYYTIENSEGNSCWGNLNVGEYVPCPSSLACNADINVSMFLNAAGVATATITSDMLLEGNYAGCNLENFEIEINDTGVVGYYFSGIGLVEIDQAGIYTYTITDPSTDNECWGYLYVESSPTTDCPDIDDVNYPANIDLALNNLNSGNITNILNPDNFVSQLGFTEDEAFPSWEEGPISCFNLFYTYDDVIIELGNGSYKIIRTWTVLDWLTGMTSTGVQIINNVVFPGLICDFLPNSAPLGDCDSGHTNDDDVEWPDDLLDLADYRIKPGELETFSMIEEADTKPIFVNNEDEYSADYIDILNELQINEITVNRVWTVSTGSTVVANYTQTLVIDISNFSSLVSVNTIFDRPIPEVELTSNNMTNLQGVGYVEGENTIEPIRSDDPLNGLTLKDLIMMRQYIVGTREFTDFQKLAGDVLNNGSITAVDLLELQKAVLGISTSPLLDWRFIDNTENVESSLNPKANYIGIKPGDVDDDAILIAEPQTESATMLLTDVLINNGESYETTLEYDGEELSVGVEIHLYYDENLIDVEELSVDNADLQLEYNIDNPGEIHLTLTHINLSGFLFSGENLVNIKFTASSNGLLSQAINEESLRNSYLVGLDYRLVVLNVEIADEINTGTVDSSEHSSLFNVSPNPATDFVNFNFLEETPKDFTIQFFDANGKLIFQESNESIINVSSLSSGIYFYRLMDGNKAYAGRLNVIK